MPKHIDLEELLARNPQIDPKRLDEARELHRRLRERGVRRKGYDLAHPFGVPRVAVRDDRPSEPRLSQYRDPDDAE